jgi:hypothetical protein
MTFKDLQKLISSSSSQQQQEQEEESSIEKYNPRLSLLLSRLRNKPFYIWDKSEHSKRHELTKGNCCFNHIIGLPKKDGIPMPMFDYEKIIYDCLITNNQKLLWIKKATGLGITEFMLRMIVWLATKDDAFNGKQVVIVTGPNWQIAITLIKRLKALFLRHLITFSNKETVLELNGCRIESYPSHNIDAFRALESPKFILLDECDFFPPQSMLDIRNVAERYIAKSNPVIAMVSTPNAPDGLFESIEREPEDKCIYKRLFLDYTYGLNHIYTEEEIAKAKQSPSFPREYDLKYLGLIGNVFHSADIDRAIEKGRSLYIPPNSIDDVNFHTHKSLGIDPGFGSSAFGVVVVEHANSQLQVLHAEEYQRATFENMISTVSDLLQKYGRSINKIYVDASNPAFIRSLKIQLGEDEYYEEIISDYRKKGWDHETGDVMTVIPVPFSTQHKAMLGNVKILMEKDDGHIAIHPSLTKLITALRTATEKGEGVLDKEATSYDDCFDAFRLAMYPFTLRSKDEPNRMAAMVKSFEMDRRFS